MATVHFGRLKGHAGFSKTVAIKQLHPSFAEDVATVSTILDEARLASRIQHPNVVATLDVVVEDADILLVLEYIHGESLAWLLRHQKAPMPIGVAIAVVASMLRGLHAAHEARGEDGEPLAIVHRDVSPQNVIVGVDGLARVLDFGIAKARGRLQSTLEGQVKGKLSYMAPEQIRRGEVTRRTDIFAAGIVLWESLSGSRLFTGDNEGHVMTKVLEEVVAPPSASRSEVSDVLDAIVMRALDRDPRCRFETAQAFAVALEACGPVAPPSIVSAWVESALGDALVARAERVAHIERGQAESAPARPRAAEIETLPDAAPSAEVTKTENRALSLPAPSIARPIWRRWALAGGIAVTLAAVTALVWATRQPDAPSREIVARTSGSPAALAPEAPTAKAAGEPSELAEAPIAADDIASSSPTLAPKNLGRRPTSPAPSHAASAQSAPAPAKSSPFYRME